MVAVLDGVWLCTRKNIALKFPFDERSLKGFHCYDLDFSLNVGLNHDFIITYNVLLERFSEGNYDRAWFEETLKLHEKWKDMLPINKAGISKKDQFNLEKAAFKDAIGTMVKYGYSKLQIFKLLKSQRNLYNQVGYRLLFSLINYLVKYRK